MRGFFVSMPIKSTNVDRDKFQSKRLSDAKVGKAIDTMLAIKDDCKRNRANRLLHGILEKLEEAQESGLPEIIKLERAELTAFIERYKEK